MKWNVKTSKGKIKLRWGKGWPKSLKSNKNNDFDIRRR